MLQKISISNKCCSVELFINQDSWKNKKDRVTLKSNDAENSTLTSQE